MVIYDPGKAMVRVALATFVKYYNHLTEIKIIIWHKYLRGTRADSDTYLVTVLRFLMDHVAYGSRNVYYFGYFDNQFEHRNRQCDEIAYLTVPAVSWVANIRAEWLPHRTYLSG